MTDMEKAVKNVKTVLTWARYGHIGPYNCEKVKKLLAEALEVLEAMGARVLTFQEMDELAHKLEETPLYYERRRACGTLANAKTGEPLKEAGRGGLFGAIAGDTQGRTPNLSMIGNVTNQTNEYGVTWRCWTAKPTKEQMAETPWEEE